MDDTLTIHEGDPHYAKKPLTEWGPFRILESVGQGAFGEVYRAFDTVLEREVALKLLLPRLSSKEEQEREILREARLLARVRHPNVLPVYGVDTYEGRVGFWSDFVRGKTLTSLLASQGPFSPRETALAGIDLCRALSAVHAAGLLHRDIKGSNVMREEGGRMLLMDFGLSLEDRDPHKMAGTPTYMAPELFRDGTATVMSDIYALGILLYYLLTGKYPVDAPTLPEFTEAHETRTPRSIYDERPDVPEKLAQAIETAVRKDPAGRFQSAGQMLAALNASIATESAEPVVVPPPPKKTSKAWIAAVGAAAAAALLSTGAWLWLRPKQQPAPSAGAYSAYLQAQEQLDKYYLPKNLENALLGFQKTIRLDPQFAVGWGGLCRASYLSYSDHPSSEMLTATQAACARALELNRDQASVHVTLGMLYTQMNRNDLAAQELETALRLDSKDAEAFGALADLYARQGRAHDVEPAFQKASDLAPGDWRWSNQLGRYYLDNGRVEEAAKQYQAAVTLSPGNSRAWNNLGIAYRRQNKFEKAKEAYRKAIDLEPADNYIANLATVLEQEGRYQEAADLFQEASALNPRNYVTLANLASAYDRIPGGHAKAQDSYRKAIALAEDERKKTPRDATLLSRLGSYYATLGRSGNALPLLRQAAALEPDNPQVLFRAAEGYELLHQRDEALRWIEQALAKKYSLEALKRNPEMKALIADRRFVGIAAKAVR